jgi:pentatricopeptide repeat protein
VESSVTFVSEMIREGKHDHAKSLFNEMISSIHQPSATTYIVFISSYCKIGRIEEAEHLNGEMERDGVNTSGWQLHSKEIVQAQYMY